MRMRRVRARIASAAASLLAMAAQPVLADPPRRIVSLNVCTDQLVLDLVPRDRIAGLSWVAADRNVSPIADAIGGITLLRGAAEEVLALDPDLVIAGSFTTPATVDLLRRLGRRVEVVPLATDLDGIRAALRQVARAVGADARGEEILSAFDARIAAVPPPGARRITAIAYQVNSLVSGQGSLLDAAMRVAGLDNGANDSSLGRGGRMELELLVANPPDLLVLAQAPDTYRTVVAENLRHPALRRLLASRPHLVLPMPLWLCGTPRLAEAITQLAAYRRAVTGRSQ